MRYIILFFAIFLFAMDLDFDGVEDSKDYCPYSDILAIVNKKGCANNKLFNTKIEIDKTYIKNKNFTTYNLVFYHKTYSLSIKKSQKFVIEISKKFIFNHFYLKPSYTFLNRHSISLRIYYQPFDFLATVKRENKYILSFQKYFKTTNFIFIPYLIYSDDKIVGLTTLYNIKGITLKFSIAKSKDYIYLIGIRKMF